MRILHQYKVTTNVLHRFKRVVAYEEKYCHGVHDRIDRLIITDKETPIDLPESFKNTTVIRRELTIDGIFNESKARNHGMNYALEQGYDYLLDGDCDRVLLEFPVNRLPMSYDVSNVPYYASKEHETDEEIDRLYREGEMSFRPASWFVLSRAVLESIRFHEGFKFNRYEDFDFFFTVAPSFGFKMDLKPDAGIGKGIHIWHSEGERGYAYAKDNEALYRARQEMYAKLKAERGGTLPRTSPAECP